MTTYTRDATARHHRQERERGLGAWDTEVRNNGLMPDLHTEVGLMPCPPAAQKALGLQADTVVAFRRRLMRALDDSEEVFAQSAISFIPKHVAEHCNLMGLDVGPGGIKSRMDGTPFEQVRYCEEVNLHGGAIRHFGYAGSGQCVEYTEIEFHSLPDVANARYEWKA